MRDLAIRARSPRKIEWLSAICLLLALLAPSAAFASLDFLTCSDLSPTQYQDTCRSEVTCRRANESLDNACLEEKARACYCLTFLGSLRAQFDRFRQPEAFQFSHWQIHGNYCGFRANLKNARTGGPLDWENGSEVALAYGPDLSTDPVDAVCRMHDIRYDQQPIDICTADQLAIRDLMKFARDRQRADLKIQELAVVIAKTIEMNGDDCKFMTFIKNAER